MTRRKLSVMVANNDHFAAALAAAAELAKSGAFIYSPEPKNEMVFPVSIPQSPASDIISNASDEEKDSEDAEKRVARSRERNREHARRTRLRKKAQLEALQSKVKGLQAESKVLRQSLEECNTASILVGLSHGETETSIQPLVEEAVVVEDQDVLCLVGGKRKRFIADASDKISQPLKIKIDGQNTLIGGGRTHINWKSGVYTDENGNKRQLNQYHLESLRRERNRMHAKMTRDRKKSFISTIEKTIEKLETNNKRMKDTLQAVVQTHFKSTASVPGVTPVSSPQVNAVSAPQHVMPHFDMSNKRARIEL
eukprot:scaffold26938_cov113-Cylindrotheca_fusiformis.AAC.2